MFTDEMRAKAQATRAANRAAKFATAEKAPEPKSEQKPDKEFEGLTPTDCCDACTPERCVISGIGICSHPFKSALQPAQMMQPDVLKRYRRAKRMLGEAKLNLQQLANG